MDIIHVYLYVLLKVSNLLGDEKKIGGGCGGAGLFLFLFVPNVFSRQASLGGSSCRSLR